MGAWVCDHFSQMPFYSTLRCVASHCYFIFVKYSCIAEIPIHECRRKKRRWKNRGRGSGEEREREESKRTNKRERTYVTEFHFHPFFPTFISRARWARSNVSAYKQMFCMHADIFLKYLSVGTWEWTVKAYTANGNGLCLLFPNALFFSFRATQQNGSKKCGRRFLNFFLSLFAANSY